jgi:hypothetical protein
VNTNQPHSSYLFQIITIKIHVRNNNPHLNERTKIKLQAEVVPASALVISLDMDLPFFSFSGRSVQNKKCRRGAWELVVTRGGPIVAFSFEPLNMGCLAQMKQMARGKRFAHRSPIENIRSNTMDERVEIRGWQWCCIEWEMLTGSDPCFGGILAREVGKAQRRTDAFQLAQIAENHIAKLKVPTLNGRTESE